MFAPPLNERLKISRMIDNVRQIGAVVLRRAGIGIKCSRVNVAVHKVGEKVATLQFRCGPAVKIAARNRLSRKQRRMRERLARVGIVKNGIDIARRTSPRDSVREYLHDPSNQSPESEQKDWQSDWRE